MSSPSFGSVFRLHLSLLPLWMCGLAVSAEPVPPTVRLLVPAYFYPSGEGLQAWRTLIHSAAKVPITAIVNPDSGPGKRVDPNYSEIFQLGKNSRITLIGYVTLSYAKRPVSEVKADINRWLTLYPEIRGIFFDEQPSGVEQVQFTEECFAYARQKIPKAALVSNPGVLCAREYLMTPSAPTVCLFEHHEGFAKYRLPDWAEALPPKRFAVLHYDLKTADEMRRTLQSALQQRAGYVFLTDRPAPTPWEGLPGYWQEEVDLISKTNQMIDVPQVNKLP